MSDDTKKFDRYQVLVYTLDDEQHVREFNEGRRGTIFVNVDWEDQPIIEPKTLAHDFAEDAMRKGALFHRPNGVTMYIPASRIKKVYVMKELP